MNKMFPYKVKTPFCFESSYSMVQTDTMVYKRLQAASKALLMNTNTQEKSDLNERNVLIVAVYKNTPIGSYQDKFKFIVNIEVL